MSLIGAILFLTVSGNTNPAYATDAVVDWVYNGNPDSAWREVSGVWALESGGYSEISSSSNAPAFSLVNFTTEDMTIFVKANDQGTGGYQNFFTVFAFDEVNGKAYWAGAKVGQDKWTIEEIDLSTGGSWPPLAESPVENIETNTWYDLKVEVNGNTVTLYAKKETETDYGDLKVTYTFNDPVRFPNGIPMGEVGLGGKNNHAHFDKFWVIVRNDTPVLSPGSSGDWDEKFGAHGGAVKWDENIYKMWYTGINSTVDWKRKTGYATSLDGVTWTKYDPDGAGPMGKFMSEQP